MNNKEGKQGIEVLLKSGGFAICVNKNPDVRVTTVKTRVLKHCGQQRESLLRPRLPKRLHLWLAAALHTSMMAFFQIFWACTASWSSPHVDLRGKRGSGKSPGAERQVETKAQAVRTSCVSSQRLRGSEKWNDVIQRALRKCKPSFI